MKGEKKLGDNEIIYFVSEKPFCEMVKIGKTTTSIKQRLTGLQTGNPRKLMCLASFERPKKYNYENMFHEILSEKHIRGEWFNLSLFMLEKIKYAMSGNNTDREIQYFRNEFSIGAESYFVDEIAPINKQEPEFYGEKEKSREESVRPCANEADSFLYEIYKDVTKKTGKKNTAQKNKIMKHNLLKYYGLYAIKDKCDLFNDVENMKKYSDKHVMKFYREMVYRDMTIEFVEKIDAERTVNMSDDEKLTYRYLAGKHAIVCKIREIFKDGFVEYPIILEYVKSLHRKKIPQLVRFKEPENQNVMSIIDELIRPYGMKSFSKQVGKGSTRRKIMSIKDISSELFEIKVLPYNSNNDIINNTLQSGQTNKPVVIVYSC